MKLISILITLLSIPSLFSQEIDNQILEKIYSDGNLYTNPLKNGEIESLRNTEPPNSTWLFSKLEDYKQNIGSNNILYGTIIIPIVNTNLVSYNLFAYDIKKRTYYFVAIVSYKISENDVMFDQAYLFTEKEALNSWWSYTFSFYQNDIKNKIPEKYVFDVCPPPPFGFEE